MLTLQTKQIKSTMKTRRLNHGTCLNLNATVKGGISMFAPTWEMVNKIKAGIINQEIYTNQYLELMRKSYKLHTKAWLELLKFDTITIGCYCKKENFCHRHLLADIISKIAKANKTKYYIVDECRQAD